MCHDFLSFCRSWYLRTASSNTSPIVRFWNTLSTSVRRSTSGSGSGTGFSDGFTSSGSRLLVSDFTWTSDVSSWGGGACILSLGLTVAACSIRQCSSSSTSLSAEPESFRFRKFFCPEAALFLNPVLSLVDEGWGALKRSLEEWEDSFSDPVSWFSRCR